MSVASSRPASKHVEILLAHLEGYADARKRRLVHERIQVGLRLYHPGGLRTLLPLPAHTDHRRQSRMIERVVDMRVIQALALR